MNPEKQGLKFEPVFHDAIDHAVAKDGTSFDEFLSDAEEVYAESKRRNRSRKPAIAPDKGFSPGLRKIIGRELPMIEGESLQIKWVKMSDGGFIDIDFPSRTVLLNKRFRSLFVPMHGGMNDAPVLKALLYLLTHHVFEGQHLGAKDKDEIDLWKSVLTAAAVAELNARGGK
jgi:hypothetical protein